MNRSQGLDIETYISGMSEENIRDQFGSFLVDDEHKVIACLHFKVASASWNYIFINNSAKGPVTKDKLKGGARLYLKKYGFHRLRDEMYSAADIKFRLKNYYKFMAVRHPLHRLVSAFRDKLREDNVWYNKYLGSKILQKWLAQFVNAPLCSAIDTEMS